MTDQPGVVRTQQIWIDDDGIGRVVYPPQAEVTLMDAQAIITTMQTLTGGAAVPLCVDMVKIKSMTGESRQYFASEASTRAVTAVALLIGSTVTRVMGNFFLGLNKPTFPVKMFTAEPEAIAWLKDFLT